MILDLIRKAIKSAHMNSEALPLLPQIEKSFQDTADFQTISIGELDGEHCIFVSYLL